MTLLSRTNAHWLCFQKHIPDSDCQLYSLTLATVDGLVRRTDGNWAGTTYKLPSLVCVSLCGNAKKGDMSVSFPCQFFIDCDIVSDLSMHYKRGFLTTLTGPMFSTTTKFSI